MKVQVEIDCTPEEARRFLGLPDLRPVQEAVMAKLQQQVLDAADALSPEAMLRQWVPLAPQTPDQMRDAMARMVSLFMPGGTTPPPPAGGPGAKPPGAKPPGGKPSE